LTRNLWFDVEDLFEYAASNPRPSGIQRLAYEIYRAVQQSHGALGGIHFVRHDQVHGTFTVVSWATVTGLFDQLTNAPEAERRSRPGPSSPARAGGIAAESRPRWLARRLVHRLSPGVRQRLLAAARLQLQAGFALVDLLGFVTAGAVARLRRAASRRGGARSAAPGQTPPDPARDFAALARPGDMLVVLGAPWSHPDYAGLIRQTKTRYGVMFAVLIFDIIPIRRPEWCDRGLVRIFRAWFLALLPQADIILAISRSTADDVEDFAARNDIPLRARVKVIPIGTGFGGMAPAPAVASDRLPPAGSYALFVSTIEARKNHLLLFRVWRRLLEEMPPDSVPTLVFAGRVGWLVEDLMKQLENTDYLNRKIRLVEDVSDAELAGLYRGCQFTLFPSLYEGWGLPVTESMAFGKPCIVARSSSLPEAGGRLARYFDPENVSDAYSVIRAVIEDPEGLRAWQAEIVRCFEPVPWAATGHAILHYLSMAPRDDARATMSAGVSHDGDRWD